MPNPETPELPVGSDDLALPFEDRLRALSAEAKTWLHETCNRLAEGEGYEKNESAIAECVAAGLIRKRRRYIDIHEDVMGLVYSENFFGRNA